jgi:hypothetical protein
MPRISGPVVLMVIVVAPVAVVGVTVMPAPAAIDRELLVYDIVSPC